MCGTTNDGFVRKHLSDKKAVRALSEKLQNVSQHENAGGDIADMNFVRLREMPAVVVPKD